MRCIEISMDFLLHLRSQGLIETWDVLILQNVMKMRKANDRLIETWDVLKSLELNQPATADQINRNMRCIEISLCCNNYIPRRRLIETWDVLKSAKRFKYVCNALINRNMRCIEIIGIQIFQALSDRLIETWDVLK